MGWGMRGRPAPRRKAWLLRGRHPHIRGSYAFRRASRKLRAATKSLANPSRSAMLDVPSQSPTADLVVAEVPLHIQERMHHLGPADAFRRSSADPAESDRPSLPGTASALSDASSHRAPPPRGSSAPCQKTPSDRSTQRNMRWDLSRALLGGRGCLDRAGVSQ